MKRSYSETLLGTSNLRSILIQRGSKMEWRSAACRSEPTFRIWPEFRARQGPDREVSRSKWGML